jgi:CxxC-x17-CxxC domain-containing protein
MDKFKRGGKSGFKRGFKRGGFGKPSFGGRDGGEREMHHAVCSGCGKDCEVPFRPTGSKPVYCSDCFRKNNGESESGSFRDRAPRRGGFERRSEPRPQSNKELQEISRKLDRIIELLQPVRKPAEKKEEVIQPAAE